jgi:anti-sigma B factor antagonist
MSNGYCVIDILDGDGGQVWIRLSGDVDHACHDQLDAAADQVTAVPARPVLVDLSEVTFLDSRGLAFLIRLRNHAQPAGHQVTLHEPPPTVRRVLEIAGMDQLFPVTGDPDPLAWGLEHPQAPERPRHDDRRCPPR